MRNRTILVSLAASVLCACEPTVTFSGIAAVIDGDSLRIDGASIRVYGIDAPEGRQTCLHDGAPWRCGEAATAKLKTLVDGYLLSCAQKDIDSYDRSVAVCTNGTVDIGREMVLAGLALAYRQYSTGYVDEEAEARASRRGLWDSEFTPPWDWRANPEPAETESHAGRNPATRRDGRPPAASHGACVIKGNINREGERIYHVPGSPWYDQTIIDPARGERWFCAEDEARAAGWRAPRG